MIISISSLKGGVGKSTISQNLAVLCSHAGLKTAIVDADTNQSSIKWSSLRDKDLPSIPVFGLPDGNALVTNAKKLEETHDMVIIDGTPSLNQSASRIIMIADFLIIPILPSQIDLSATEKFIEHYWNACNLKGHEIPASFVINRYKKSTIASDVQNVLQNAEINIGCYESTINDRIAYSKAFMEGKGVFELNDEKGKSEMSRFFNETNDILTKLFNKEN